MANYCGVFTNQKGEDRQLSDNFISFQDLSNLTCHWLDDIQAWEELYRRQVLKISDNEKKLVDTQQLVMLSSEILTKSKQKLDIIEKAILENSLNLEMLELFVNSLESWSADGSPLALDRIRYPVYNELLNLMSLIDENQENMERFNQEYQKYRGTCQKFIFGTIFDYHVKILENIETHLNQLERSIKIAEETFTHSPVSGILNSLS